MTTAPDRDPITPEEVERRLAEDPQPEPPLELLDRLRQEIPGNLDLSGTGERYNSGPRTWLLAATLATVVLGGFLAWRLGELNQWSVEPTRAGTEGGGPVVEVSVQTRSRDDRIGEAAVEPQEPRAGKDDGAMGNELEALQSGSEVKAVAKPEGRSSRAGVDGDREVAAEWYQEGISSSQPSIGLEREQSIADTVVVESLVIASEEQVTSGNQRHQRKLREAQGYRLQQDRVMPASPPSTGGTHEPNDQPYGDMFFKGYGTNPFLDPEEDRLSTFGLDVDTGSYTIARSYLQRGHLPPAEAIRVEEFLNYFDYRDPAPEGRTLQRADFTLTAEGAPSPFAEHQDYFLLRFGIQGRQIADRDRPPSTLVFVVDVSGSMRREDRLGLVKRSLTMLLEQLDDGDRVGLVVYGSRGEVLLEPTRDHDRIRAAIDRLQASGSTNAEEGLVLAYDLAREFYREGGNHRVILCSDGVANVGRTGPGSILERIGREADAGIELTTVGFGMGNYNDVLMEQLADKGDGRYAYVDDLKEARRLFVEELTGTLQTIASDAKVQVEFNPGAVERYRLIGYENRDIADERFRDDTVDAGEIGAGHYVTALYEIKLRDGVPARREIATLRLRYHSKAAGEIVEQELPMRRTGLDRSMGNAANSLQLAALVAEFGEILKGSYWAKDGDLDRVLAGARDIARATSDPKVAEFRDLVEIAARVSPSADTDTGWIEE